MTTKKKKSKSAPVWPKFVQIAASALEDSDYELFALDEAGNVWSYGFDDYDEDNEELVWTRLRTGRRLPK